MSKLRVAGILAAVTILATGPVSARRLGLGGVFGGVRSVLSHLVPHSGHRTHHAARNPHDRTAALEPRVAAESRPDTATPRSQVVAAAALAGWHGDHAAGGWWRHQNGSYGWVGPLFWPLAFDDIYDYVVRGERAGFWGYGYKDIFAAIFAPYGAHDLAAYQLRSTAEGSSGRTMQLQELCGADVEAISGRAVQGIAQLVQPNAQQSAALQEFAKAAGQAAYVIHGSCPAKAALNGPDRLSAMQDRIAAMITAISLLRAPFAGFYDQLDDEQKARLTRRDDQRTSEPPGNSDCDADPLAALPWPTSEIDAGLHPDHRQHVALATLEDTALRAANVLKPTCPAADAATPAARFNAANRRLIALLQAIRQVRAALDDCFATLSDGQKQQLEAIGPRRAS